MKSRVFVAIKIDEDALNKIISVRKRFINNDLLNWESNDKLHITLKFIGEVENEDLKKIIKILESISRNHSPFDLWFSKFGIFKRSKSSILWAGIRKVKSLVNLHSDVNQGLNIFSMNQNEKQFNPHVTLLRNRKNIRINNLNEFLLVNISDIKFRVNEYYLIKSELTPKGSIYTELEKFKLK